MSASERSRFFSGLKATSLGVLLSRVLGMARDVATAGLLGLAGGGVMDAFVVAFRIPNLFRRLFGEGALTAAYVPVFTECLQKDRVAAWRLASVAFVALTVVLAAAVLLGEGICLLLAAVFGESPQTVLLVYLTAVMLPYVVFICGTALLAATLQSVGRFAAPALASTLLNICWLAAAGLAILRGETEKTTQAYYLVAGILIAGVLQLALQWAVLRRQGFRFEPIWREAKEPLLRIVKAMGPALLGLAVTQVNTLLDSLIAWGLAASATGPRTIDWLGGADYPMQQGAAAATYFAERLYMFPVGLVGIAVATVLFPLLSRHAVRGEFTRLGADMTMGLRLVLFLALPASVGLMLLCEPIARLLFERGEFTAEDTARTAQVIFYYAAGVWAYSALPVLVRGYYALGDYATPVKVGVLAVGVNLVLNLTLIWPLAEAGLAAATAVSATLQLVVLTALFAARKNSLDWSALGQTAGRTVLASGAMLAAGWGVLEMLAPREGFTGRILQTCAPLVVCAAVYFAVSRLLKAPEMSELLGRAAEEASEPESSDSPD